jgi:hypothetical protein
MCVCVWLTGFLANQVGVCTFVLFRDTPLVREGGGFY